MSARARIGSRTFPSAHAVKAFVAALPDDSLVVSGGAAGVPKDETDCRPYVKQKQYSQMNVVVWGAAGYPSTGEVSYQKQSEQERRCLQRSENT